MKKPYRIKVTDKIFRLRIDVKNNEGGIKNFIQFLIDNEIPSVPNSGGSSGRGCYIGYFYEEDKKEILAFLRGEK